MVAVEIRTPIYDEESGQFAWRGRALVRADGDSLDIFGEVGVIDESLPVVDPATGKQLRGTDDPEAWARNLPYAYRSGDLIAVVLIDTDAPPLEEGGGSDVPTIPLPPEVTRFVGGATMA